MIFPRMRQSQAGLTLIETMASILIFGVITLGITPLFISSVRGSALSRSYTVGKNVAQESMERLRGLPYYISFATQSKKVDILDLYFPSLGSGYVAGSGSEAYKFSTTCTSASAASATCPGGIPAGYTVTYETQFVTPVSGASETYAPAVPASNYSWNSTTDVPPTRLLRAAVVVRWTQNGVGREFRLASLFGDRKVGGTKVAGNARVAYGVQVITSFNVLGLPSEIFARAGIGDATVESRLLAEADINVSAGTMRLTRPASGDDQASDLGNSPYTGATSIYHAPPDVTSGTIASAPAGTLLHPDLLNAPVAHLTGSTTTTPLRSQVSDESPIAEGGFNANSGADDTAIFWVNNQAEAGQNTKLQLNAVPPAAPLFAVKKTTGQGVRGAVSSITGALGAADRGVRSRATVSLGRIRLFPVFFISTVIPGDNTVIRIENFTASVDCNSTASATASVAATYSATVRVWTENDWSSSSQLGDNDAVSPGAGYKDIVLSGISGTDPLAQYGPEPEKNPLVWESRTPAANLSPVGVEEDIYLFPLRHDHIVDGLPTPHNHPGYLSTWSSAANVSGTKTANNRNTTAQVPGAIGITTVPLNPTIAASGLNISIGNLGCSSGDAR